MQRKYMSKGVTLIEILLVTSLMILVGMAVYGVFSLGVAVYKRAEIDKPRNEMMIFSERLADDIRNIMLSPEKDFIGTSNRLIFHIHRTKYLISKLDTGEEDPILRVEYVYEASNNSVVRRSYKYGAAKPYSSVTLLKGTGTVKFSYVKAEDRSSIVEFLEKTEIIPRSLKVEIVEKTQNSFIFSRILDIPISGS